MNKLAQAPAPSGAGGKPPPPAAAPSPPPSLESCIKSMKSLGTEAAALSTRKQAELINAMTGYCLHVAIEMGEVATLLRSGKECSFDMPFDELHAMRALVTDPDLFRCVLSMLSHKPSSGGTTTTGSQAVNQMLPSGSSYNQNKSSRKRSPSEDVSHTSRKKLMLSPTPISRVHPKQSQMVHVAPGVECTKGQISERQIPVFAATILYSVFQHAEHWPLQIMQAFAEDSFGQRNWVDDERCKAFVANLSMSLEPQKNAKSISNLNSASVAEDVEKYFSSLMSRASDSKHSISPGDKISNGTTASSSKQKTPSIKEKRKQMKIGQSDESSSSSGEEEVLTVSSSLSKSQQSPAGSSSLRGIFQPGPISKQLCRSRYHMSSLNVALEVTFEDRLNSKSKQNYRLLQVLPSFVSISRVRLLASKHLERWLQSPALAGLARVLLSRIVQELGHDEPPLSDDLEVISNILKLNLKANQLSMHIEHVAETAKKIPTRGVAKLIFTHCLQGECTSGSVSNSFKPNDDHLRMLRSVYAVLDKKLAADALASSVACLASKMLKADTPSDLNVQFQNMRCLLCAVVDALGKLHDGFHFVKAIIDAQFGMSKTISSLKKAARLIFECALLVTRIPLQAALEARSQKYGRDISVEVSDWAHCEELDSFRESFLGLRKAMLRWCESDLCAVFHKRVTQEEQTKCADSYYERGAVTRGPGAPDYGSVLDVNTPSEYNDQSSPFHRMMALLRCLLFLSLPSSKELQLFLMAEEGLEKDQIQQIDFCCQFGVDVDDELINIILSSDNVTPITCISIIENLLSRCKSNSSGKISCSVDTVWNMYDLAEYSPVFRPDYHNNVGLCSFYEQNEPIDKDRDADQSGMVRENRQGSEAFLTNPDRAMPRLAITSQWWRVSCIALVLSGVLPEPIGETMWNQSPTVRALIRMTTSQKYRFPTVELSSTEKEKVRVAEEKIREEEAKIAEFLFMPPQPKKPASIEPPTINPPTYHRRGLRSSARQREKKEKMVAIEQERQAAALQAETMKLRKVLKTLQKNVMVWEPTQEQRKPPKGSIDLLLSVNDGFDLAEKFRLSPSPDFLLRTIGEGRSAIERAYDWLIPIISSQPVIIDRLQPSASCFLLLRAYGVEGDKNKEMLLELTAPLLAHVRKCVAGVWGNQHQLLAMELLLQDLADESDDRRRCARKVLQETAGSANVSNSSDAQYNPAQVIYVKNCKELIPLVIKYTSRALAYERGEVLSTYIRSLSVLEKQGVDVDFDFVATLCQLITIRPHVCSDAFDRVPILRSLAIEEVKNAFEQAIAGDGASSSSLISISIPRGVSGSNESNESAVSNVSVSPNLLHAAIILVSNWQRRDEGAVTQSKEEESILNLLRYLIVPFLPKGSKGLDKSTTCGLLSARFGHTKKRAVSVDEWVLLAKARAEEVAEHAASSAPNIFLPRLLLCCGMPKLSFHTMLRRLDAMVDNSTAPGKIFEALVTPAAVSEWGLSGIGSRRIIKRKLYGRILAYTRIFSGKYTTEREVQDAIAMAINQSPFISWLSSEMSGPDSARKLRQKNQVAPDVPNNAISLLLGSSSVEDFNDLMDEDDLAETTDGINWPKKLTDIPNSLAPSESLSQDFVTSCVATEEYTVLDEALGQISAKNVSGKEITDTGAAAKALLGTFGSFDNDQSFVRMVLKWVPMLTQDHGDKELWQLLFAERTSQKSQFHLTTLICTCALKWSGEHVAACQAWIAKMTKWTSAFAASLALRFLVASSEQKSIHCLECDNQYDSNHTHTKSQKFVVSFIRLALLCHADLKNKFHDINESAKRAGSAVDSRSVLPDWLTLTLLLGKSHYELVIELVLEKIADDGPSLDLSSAVLRLYLLRPMKTALGEKLISAMLEALNGDKGLWLDWRCPLDCQISEMLTNLSKSPHQRLVQSISDIGKKHPLVFIRHLNQIRQKLLDDGSGRDSEQQSLIKRGRMIARHPSGDVVAQIGGCTVKVTIVLWGYSFSEPLWSAVIDVMLSLPLEVVFLGETFPRLLRILDAYLMLFDVQTNQLNSESNVIRIREKFMNLVQSFRDCKKNDFENWTKEDNFQQLLSAAGIAF